MAAANRSPLGFAPIVLFHLCVLIAGVLMQNLHDRLPVAVFALFLGMAGAGAVVLAYVQRRFLWDVFRSFKSAGTLLSLLVLSCVLGTLIIQDLDLRRADVFDAGLPPPGKDLPVFSDDNKPTRFALAEAHMRLWLWPNEERERALKEKVVLSDFEKRQIRLRKKAYGERAAEAWEKAVLGSKRRDVEQKTTTAHADKNFGFYYGFYRVCRTLRLIDIFEAWWFYFLLGLIGINVIVGTFARAPWTFRDIGIAITHAGIIIILSGALLDRLVAQEGYIWFKYGDPAQQVATKIEDKKNRTFTHLPFEVRLDRFATEYYHELYVRRIDWSARHDGTPWPQGSDGAPSRAAPFSAPMRVPVRTGVTRVFEGGEIEVVVHAYKPRVLVTATVEERPAGPLDPALEWGIYAQPTGGPNLLAQANFSPWLYARDATRDHLDLPLRDGEVRFEYAWADSPAAYDRLLESAPRPDNGVLIVKQAGAPDATRVPVRLRGRQRVLVGTRTVEVAFQSIQSAFADSENVNLDRRLQRTEEPRLHLLVDGQAVAVPRDDRRFMSGFDALDGLEFRFEWPDPRDKGVFDIYRIVHAEGQRPALVQRDARGDVIADVLEEGATVRLRGMLDGYYFAAGRAVRSARAEIGVREVSDEEFLQRGGGAGDDLLAAWMDVEIRGPWGTVRKELTPYDEPIAYGDAGGGRPLYTLALARTEAARDWFSVLTVVDKNGDEVASHAVQVNAPLRYGGYRFFQANAGQDQDGFGVSGISVTYNPGVYFMYVGYTVLTLGTCWIFFLRPVLDRRRRRRVREARAQ